MRLLRSLCVLAMTGMLLTGCVKRTLLIESDPPGAKVWINETPAGITPVKYEFITHGRYKLRLEKSGFREVIAREMVRAPVYEWIPLDFIFEILVPIHLEDKHLFRYTLIAESPAERLEAQKPRDLEAGLKGLSDPNPKKRRAACLALARARDPSTAEQVLNATHDPVPIVRKSALQALRAVLGPKSRSRLLELLAEDRDPEVRWQAAVELEALKDKQAVPALIRALRDHHPLVRAGAAEALDGIPDPRAVGPLIVALRDHDTATRRAAAEALGKIGDRAAVKPLIRALSFHDFRARRRAAQSLAQLKDPSSTLALARTLDNWDPPLREISVQALIQFQDTRVVPFLIHYLHSWHPWTRSHAATVLGALKDLRAVEPLVRAFRREPVYATSQVMLEALRSLGAKPDASWEELQHYRKLRMEWQQQKQQQQREKKKREQPKQRKTY